VPKYFLFNFGHLEADWIRLAGFTMQNLPSLSLFKKTCSENAGTACRADVSLFPYVKIIILLFGLFWTWAAKMIILFKTKGIIKRGDLAGKTSLGFGGN
jgi:hypothetical protein